MRPINLSIFGTFLAVAFAISVPSASGAEKLGDILRQSKWDNIVGTWVDAQTQGNTLRLSFAWKIEERLIEVSSEYNSRQTVALMGVNAKTGDVFHVGADSDGTSVFGKWEVDDNGDALLDFEYATVNGQEGEMRIRYHREDEDTVIMTIELPDPIVAKLIRSNSKE